MTLSVPLWVVLGFCAWLLFLWSMVRLTGSNRRKMQDSPRSTPHAQTAPDRRSALEDAAPRRRLSCRYYDPPGLWCAECARGNPAECLDPM